MKAYYNLNSGELDIIGKIYNYEINSIKFNEECSNIKLRVEKPKTLKVNGEELDIIFLKISNSYKKRNKKNLNGLKLIKISDNQFIKKYNLNGLNMKVGIIDGGAVFNHYEFSNNNRIKFTQTKNTSEHSTHVSGTISAYGYNNRAKGCCSEVEIYSYYFGNFIGNLSDCGKKEINVVNNSYGFNNGWDYNNKFYGFNHEYYMKNKSNNLEYPQFGSYSFYSQQIDQISNTYPNLVLCFAAGNDRNDKYNGGKWYIQNNYGSWVEMDPKIYTPPKNDGDYDCIGTLACSKNIITVGATVDTSMTTTIFSSWGPTDDLRIKPDIVANGDSVFSTLNRGYKSYGSMSGTSMACPFASGSSIIIQQFIKENLGYFPSSSTTKACLIHGIKNKIINGKNGYGLIDMQGSLQYLDNVLNKNEILLNNENIDEGKQYRFNSSNIIATLVWNDIAGDGIQNQLSLYLVNNGIFYYPYRLEKKESDAVQKNSDILDNNYLVKHDNTQKIILENLTGESIIYVQNNSQNNTKFSLCIGKI